jgi:hypothetical protein
MAAASWMTDSASGVSSCCSDTFSNVGVNSENSPLASSFPPASPHHSGFQWRYLREIWGWGLLRKSVDKLQIRLKIEKMADTTWRHTYVYIVECNMKYIVDRQQYKGKHCCVSITHLIGFTLLTAIQVNNNTKEMYSSVFTATKFTRTRYKVTLYVLYLV